MQLFSLNRFYRCEGNRECAAHTHEGTGNSNVVPDSKDTFLVPPAYPVERLLLNVIKCTLIVSPERQETLIVF